MGALVVHRTVIGNKRLDIAVQVLLVYVGIKRPERGAERTFNGDA